MEIKHFEKFFNDKIYRSEWKDNIDKDIILNDFKEFVNTMSFRDKIRIMCYNNFYLSKDLFNLDKNKTENNIRKEITKLNKNLELDVKKQKGINTYKTSNKGIKLLLINISSFARENKYLKQSLGFNIEEKIINEKEIIKGFHSFLNDLYKKEIQKLIYSEEKSLIICFNDISMFDFNLSENLLEYPDECLNIFNNVLKNCLGEENDNKEINIRLINLPSSENVKIGSHRKKHIDKLITMEGLIRRKSDVKPMLKNIMYICTNLNCEYKINIPQFEEKIRTIKACPKCKSGVELIKEELEDSMLLILEQDFKERNKDNDSKKIHIKIDSDLTDEIKYNNLKISSKINVIGVLKKIFKTTKGGAQSINYEYILEANNIIFMEEEEDLNLTKEDIEEFKLFAKNKNCFKILRDSYLPSIYGNKQIKESLMLQHIGSSFDDERNDSHILLLGDPSTAKTEMIYESLTYNTRYIYSSGTSSSAAGLTATAMKDELTGTWVLESGVLPRANGGMAALDEMDKLNDDDGKCLTEALEQQRIHVCKANIFAVLETKCAFLTGANPKYGRFDPNEDITKQINFDAALLSRFDLIFILKDIAEEKKDKELINHILDTYDNIEKDIETKYDKEFIKKYLFYCKTYFKPKMSKEVRTAISNYYINVRKIIDNDVTFSFTPRQIKGVIRFAAAYAKFHQKDIIELDHIQYVFKLFNNVLSDLGVENLKSIERINIKEDK